MTREAKIGLLLGLAFIVAIAVVLRGVHQDGPAIPAELGVARQDDGVVPISERVEEVVNAGADRRRRAKQEPLWGPVVVPLVGRNGGSTVAETPRLPVSEVRYEQELPGRTGPGHTVVLMPPRGRQGKGLETMVVPVEPEPLIALAPLKVFMPKKIWQKKKVAEQVYVVKEGDSLSKIALAVYGQVEGKRWVNVARIHQANRGEMPGIDAVFPGQRLKIPRLVTAASRRRRIDEPGRARASKGTRRRGGGEYVVRENDSLWKIAARELGNGARYGEIRKLNAGTLRDEDMLQPGMRLRMP